MVIMTESLSYKHSFTGHIGELPIRWDLFTRSTQKRLYYSNEIEPRQCWLDALVVFGESIYRFLDTYTFIIIKPELIKRGGIDALFLFLNRNKFLPVSATKVRIDRIKSTSIWRYQWNKATLDRIALTCQMGEVEESIVVLLKDLSSGGQVPAAVRLWGLKGSAVESKRSKHHLRTILGMRNRMIGLVHCPDEPVDIIRDLGILFDCTCRKEFFRQVGRAGEKGGYQDIYEFCLAEEAAHERHDLDGKRLINQFLAVGCGSALKSLLRDHVDHGRRFRLEEIAKAFNAERSDDPTRYLWDFISISAELISHNLEGVEALIDAGSFFDVSNLWRMREITP